MLVPLSAIRWQIANSDVLAGCPADSAFGNDKVDCDWSSGKCSAFHNLEGTSIKYESKGAVFSIAKEAQAPTIMTSKYIFFGRVDIEVQAAQGPGIVTSAVLQSDDLDEIDWEWVGADNAQAQSNYFSKGDDTTFNRGAFHPVSNPLTSSHVYSVEWTKDSVQWIIDGATVRTLKASDVGKKFPQTPMQVKVGTWVGGKANGPKGTTEWSGGVADFSKGPAVAYYKSIKITDYAGGSSPASSSVKSYSYGDNSGDWQSIKVEGGSSSDSSSSASSAASTSKASSTGSSKPTSTDSSSMETSMSSATPTDSSSASKTSAAAKAATSVPGNAAGRNSAAAGLVLAAGAALFL